MSSDERTHEHDLASGPKPMRKKPVLRVLSWLGVVAAGGVFISLLTMTPGRARGATRAARLQWQQRCGHATGAVVTPEKLDDGPLATPTNEDEATCAQDSKDAQQANEP